MACKDDKCIVSSSSKQETCQSLLTGSASGLLVVREESAVVVQEALHVVTIRPTVHKRHYIDQL